MPARDLTEADYVSTVADTFLRLKGALALSPLDAALLQSWRDREIPLHVAVNAIEEVMGNHSNSRIARSVRSLSYCEEEIEARYAEWVQLRVGSNE